LNKLPNWKYKNKPITSIEDIPKGVIGFIYLLEFNDGTRYIGKKNLFTIKNLPTLKNGTIRSSAVRVFMNKNGKRLPFDRIIKETNWLKYNSSSDKVKKLIPIKRIILKYAVSKINLTYLECKYLFMLGCLESDKYHNDNILGKFYRTE
jgi:hypothetical protein